MRNCLSLFPDIQGKLQSQLKCLEDKLECQTSMVSEIQEFFKKRAEIESEYSVKLERLAKHFVTKQKQEKLKYVSKSTGLWATLKLNTTFLWWFYAGLVNGLKFPLYTRCTDRHDMRKLALLNQIALQCGLLPMKCCMLAM